MRAPRKGWNLKVQIRLALLALKRDPNMKLDRLKIEELETILRGLRTECRAAALLNEGY